jgi:mannose-6-phosphate isomerase-like protein (cupin superfamily)
MEAQTMVNITLERPTPVGTYDILTDFLTNDAGVRVFRMGGVAQRIEPHVHHRSAQIYVVLEGEARITVDGVEHFLRPYQALAVPVGVPHSAAALGPEAVLANISTPPLRFDDQLPPDRPVTPPDFELPRPGSDVED